MKYENVKEVLLELIEGDGYDHRYEAPNGDTCMYSERDGSPSCIVGQVIHRLQPDEFQALHHYEWMNVDPDSDDLYGVQSAPVALIKQRTRVDVPMDENTLALLQHVQRLQDGGIKWGPAVRDSISEINKGTNAAAH